MEKTTQGESLPPFKKPGLLCRGLILSVNHCYYVNLVSQSVFVRGLLFAHISRHATSANLPVLGAVRARFQIFETQPDARKMQEVNTPSLPFSTQPLAVK